MPDSLGLLGFEHAGISVADLEALGEWYETAPGLRPEGEFEIPALALRGRILGAAGFKLELIEMEGSEPDPTIGEDPGRALARRGIGHVCVMVEDLDAAWGRLLEAGAEGLIAPRRSPLENRRFAYVADPEGNRIELMQDTGAAAG